MHKRYRGTELAIDSLLAGATHPRTICQPLAIDIVTSALRILVTGASSSLGQSIGRELQRKGHIAIGTIRRDPRGMDLSMFHELRYADMSKPEDIQNLGPIFDSVIHAAALSVGTASELMYSAGLSTAWLAELCVASHARSIAHVSSMSVYGDISDDVVTPLTEIRHMHPYGAAKWAAECYLQHQSGQLPSVSVRSPAIVGRKSLRNFLAVVFESMITQQPIVRVSNPEFLFNNVIHEDTMASFLVHLACTTTSGFAAVPVGSTNPIPLRQVIEQIRIATRYRGRVEWIPQTTRPFSISVTAARKLGFEPLSTEETIQRWLTVT